MSEQYHFCIGTFQELNHVPEGFDHITSIQRVCYMVTKAMQEAFMEYVRVGVVDVSFTLSKVAGTYLFDPTTHSAIPGLPDDLKIFITTKLKDDCVAVLLADPDRTYELHGKVNGQLTEIMLQVH